MRFKSSIRSRIITTFGAIVVATVLILEILFVIFLRHYYFGGVEQILKDRASLSADFVNRYFTYSEVYDKSNWFFETYFSNMENRFFVQIIDKDKKVVKDSNGFSDQTPLDYSDINEAMENRITIYKGKIPATGERIMSVSRPLMRYNKVEGVIRYTVSLERVYNEVSRYTYGGFALGVVVILFFLLVSSLITQSIVNPVFSLNAVAKNMALGDYTQRAVKQYDDEIGLLADTLNYMAEEINKGDNMKKEFISSISHELRTPLTSIKGWCETLLLDDSLEKGGEMQMGLEIISSEAERLKSMVEELLDFSRLESRKMKVVKQSMSPRSLLEEVIRQFSTRTVTQSLVLEIKGEDTMVMADVNRMRQVFINILTNSLKFTPPGGKIEVTSEGLEDRVRIEFKDTGVGISKENITKVREKFFKESQTTPGSGLGLSIVDEILKIHNATMDIKSVQGEGTTITLEIPVA